MMVINVVIVKQVKFHSVERTEINNLIPYCIKHNLHYI